VAHYQLCAVSTCYTRVLPKGAGSALEKGTPLIAQLRLMPEVTKHFDEAGLRTLVDPAGYLGTSREMVDRMLARG